MAEAHGMDDQQAEGLSATRLPGVHYGVLDQVVGYPVRRAQLLIYEDFIRSLAQWNMTPPRFSALVIISQNPGLKLTDLSNILAIARSGSVLLTHNLVASGLVERRPSPTDRRAWGLYLTARGAATLEEVTAVVIEHDRRVSSALTEQERATLMHLLKKLAQPESA